MSNSRCLIVVPLVLAMVIAVSQASATTVTPMASLALATSATGPVVIGGLLGGDLTDPNNNGAPEANTNYDAIFASDDEPGFGGGENSFNVFDNQVGGGNAKWCCNDASPGSATNGPGHQLDATILPTGGNPLPGAYGGYQLTHFTITSSNDSPSRDPLNWQIQGSTDGINFTTIFDSLGVDFWATDVRNQTLRFNAGADFPMLTGQGFTTFRYSVTQTTGGSEHALGELEYFGVQATPEPASIAIWALIGVGGLGFTVWRARRKK